MKAMLLAAGRGERMRPLTDTTPKPLLRAGGKPLITWAIEQLRAAGISEIVVNHAHLGEQFARTLGNGESLGVSIQYSAEGTALETAGGIVLALDYLGELPFIAAAADIFCDFDFARLLNQPGGDDLTHLVLVDNPAHNPAGDFALNGSRVQNDGPARLTFSGIGVYRPALFAGIARGAKHALAPLLRRAADAGQVSGEWHRGRWRDIGTPERLAELERELASR